MRLAITLILALSSTIAAEDAWRFDMRLYHVDGLPEPAKEAAVLTPGEVFRIGGQDLQHRGGRLLDAAGAPPNAREVRLLASPSLVTGVGKASIRMGDGTPLQYLEHQAADQYRLRELETELAITCSVDLHVIRRSAGACEVFVDAAWTTSRAPVPGVMLPVGMPEIRRASFSRSLSFYAAEWRAVAHLVPAQDGLAPATLVLLLRAQPQEPDQPAFATEQGPQARSAAEVRRERIEQLLHDAQPYLEAGDDEMGLELLGHILLIDPDYAPAREALERLKAAASTRPGESLADNDSGAPRRQFSLETRFIRGGRELDAAAMRGLGPEYLLVKPNLYAIPAAQAQALTELIQDWPESDAQLISAPRVTSRYAHALQELSEVLEAAFAELPNATLRGTGFSLAGLPDGTRGLVLSRARWLTGYQPTGTDWAVMPEASNFDLGRLLDSYDGMLRSLVFRWIYFDHHPAVIADLQTTVFRTPDEEFVPVSTGLVVAVTSTWNAEKQQARVQAYLNGTHLETERRRTSARSAPARVHRVVGTPFLVEFTTGDGETRGFYLRDPSSRSPEHLLVLMTLTDLLDMPGYRYFDGEKPSASAPYGAPDEATPRLKVVLRNREGLGGGGLGGGGLGGANLPEVHPSMADED